MAVTLNEEQEWPGMGQTDRERGAGAGGAFEDPLSPLSGSHPNTSLRKQCYEEEKRWGLHHVKLSLLSLSTATSLSLGLVLRT